MTLVFPALFTVIFWAFWGFVMGDWSWPQHLFHAANFGFERAIVAIFYLFGMLLSFIGGAAIDMGAT